MGFFVILDIVVLVFLVPSSIVVFYLVLGLKLWRMGKLDANSQKISSGKTTVVNSLVGLLLLAIAFCFITYLLLGWEL